jgi:hypothetical protein
MSRRECSGSSATAGAALALVLAAASVATPAWADQPANDFPTVARADYVFACMQVNGQSRESLEKCACSIDVIASILTYEQYEAAETIMSIYKRGGKAQQQMGSGTQQERVKLLRQAQVEGELRCF